MDLEDLERTLHDRLDAVGPASRATLRQYLLLPDRERARRIGDLYGDPRTQAFAELMIDLEESPHARAVVLGELLGPDFAPRLIPNGVATTRSDGSLTTSTSARMDHECMKGTSR